MRGIKSCSHPHQHRPPLRQFYHFLILAIPFFSLVIKQASGVDPSNYHTSFSYLSYGSSPSLSQTSELNEVDELNEMSTSELTSTLQEDLLLKCPDNIHCTCEFKEVFNLTCSDTTFQNIVLPLNATATINFHNVSATSVQTQISSSLSSELLNKLSASLVVLSWTKSAIEEIQSGTFEEFQNLETVDVSYNKINYLPETQLFPDNSTSLVSLNLSGNNLQYLHRNVFENLIAIKEISLAENKLGTLPTGLFASLSNLQAVNLSHNVLTTLEDLFQNTTNIQSIILAGNKIKNISSTAFADLKFLKVLDLSMNNIGSIHSTIFQDLLSLENLNLRENKLSYIYPALLHNLKNLKKLDLSSNPLMSITGGIFTACKKLEVLQISNTALNHVHSSDLMGLMSLQVLILSKNTDLTTIDNGVFMNTFKLVVLDLSENNLKVLPGSVSSCCNKMQNVVLRGNPWRCGCDMMWVVDWLSSRLLVQDSLIVEDDGNLMRCDYNNQSAEGYFNKSQCSGVELVQAKLFQKFHLGSSALLECNFSGNPQPAITWITPFQNTLHWSPDHVSVFPRHPMVHDNELNRVDSSRVRVLENGNLYISQIHWGDCGKYICFAANPLSNITVYLTLSVDPAAFLAVKMISLIVGIATGAGFLLLTLGILLLQWIFYKLGWPWCCHRENVSPKTKQLKQLLDNIEQYRSQQLDKLRENYHQQVQKIRDNCTQQVDWIRESYQSQAKHIRDIRDYGTSHLTSMRDQYYDQVKRVRDYSAHQLSRVRDNYIQQRNRVRKFSAHQMIRLRETCKYQQQTLNKILENLPSLYVENCRSGSYERPDAIFDAEIIGIDMYIKSTIKKLAAELDETAISDSLSHASVYYTPTERSVDIPCESPTTQNKRYSSSTNSSSENPLQSEGIYDENRHDNNSLSSSDNVRATSTPIPRKKLKRLPKVRCTSPPNVFPSHLPLTHCNVPNPQSAEHGEVDIPEVFKSHSRPKHRKRIHIVKRVVPESDGEQRVKSSFMHTTAKDVEEAMPEEVVVLLMENKPINEHQSDVQVCMTQSESVIVEENEIRNKHPNRKESPLPPMFETAL